MREFRNYILIGFAGMFLSCSKSTTPVVKPVDPVVTTFTLSTLKVNGVTNGFNYSNVNPKPVVKLSFSAAIDHSSVGSAISLQSAAGASAVFSVSYQNNDST